MIVIVNSSQESAHRGRDIPCLAGSGAGCSLIKLLSARNCPRHVMPGIRLTVEGVEELAMHDIGGGHKPPTSCTRRQLSSSGEGREHRL
jgi:hypothetical protein